jgi:uncharacterized membrane protein YqjE
VTNGNAKTVPDAIADLKAVIADLKTELQEFITTRLAIFSAEMREKVENIKRGAPMVVVGLLVLLTAWLTLTGFLVCLVAQAFTPNPWAYMAAFAIVTVFYAVAGAGVAAFAWKAMKGTGLKPERTIHVLQQDREWLQTEARTQL